MFGSLAYEEDILMDENRIIPRYEAVFRSGKCFIASADNSHGGCHFVFEFPESEVFIRELADFLNRNAVSPIHAKDVIRDKILELL